MRRGREYLFYEFAERDVPIPVEAGEAFLELVRREVYGRAICHKHESDSDIGGLLACLGRQRRPGHIWISFKLQQAADYLLT